MNTENLIKSIDVNLKSTKKAIDMSLKDIDLYLNGSIVAIEDLAAGFECLGMARIAAYILKNEYDIPDYIEPCRVTAVYLSNCLALILERVQEKPKTYSHRKKRGNKE